MVIGRWTFLRFCGLSRGEVSWGIEDWRWKAQRIGVEGMSRVDDAVILVGAMDGG